MAVDAHLYQTSYGDLSSLKYVFSLTSFNQWSFSGMVIQPAGEKYRSSVLSIHEWNLGSNLLSS